MSESSQMTAPPAYQVLARKYRPATFEDMIGQDAMVTTLKNAFAAGRVAHAFMLTGVRGIGKTTTARLLARALNYESDTAAGPSVDLAKHGKHCELIMASTHMDVLEMDAASRTGVENMREMLDGVRYAPATARYKVYIIDEVHMLSTGAFNALLKTLEEPPDHAKFIFATTEIRKVPITVLSRCQRFDLRRVEAPILAAHLSGVCEKENVKISKDGLALIARAAEGSVRDGLSLLDQAIVQAGLDGSEVSAEQIRTMLGLADRVRILDLFEMIAAGDTKGAMLEMRAQYDDGADPAVIMRDLLDICHDISRAKILDDTAGFEAAPDQHARMRDLGEAQSTGQLTRIWQILMSAHDEVRRAPDPLASAQMAILKLSLAGQMPPPELAAQIIEAAQNGTIEGGLPQISSPSSAPATSAASAAPSATAAAPAPAPQAALSTPPAGSVSGTTASAVMSAPKTAASTAPQTQPDVPIQSLADLVAALPPSKIKLKSDIERYVRPVSFQPGKAELHISDPKHLNLIGKIVQALLDLTGELWVVSPSDDAGDMSLAEQRKQARQERDAQERAHPAFSHPLLSKAKLLGIHDRDSTIIHGNFEKDLPDPHSS